MSAMIITALTIACSAVPTDESEVDVLQLAEAYLPSVIHSLIPPVIRMAIARYWKCVKAR